MLIGFLTTATLGLLACWLASELFALELVLSAVVGMGHGTEPLGL